MTDLNTTVKKDVIILAAGIGRRLLPFTRETPKCLVSVNGVTILDNILQNLNFFHSRINKVVVVLGHCSQKIVDHIGTRFGQLPIEYITNVDYLATNNIYSLWLTMDQVTNDVLLFESDVFFEHAVIAELFNSIDAANRNLVMVDYCTTRLDGSVVTANGNNVIDRLLNRRDYVGTEPLYKTVNIYHFTKDFFQNHYKPHLELYIKTQSKNVYYETVLKVLIHIGNPKLYILNINGKKWFEIDDKGDLEIAEHLFSAPDRQITAIQNNFGGYWNFDFIDYNLLYNDYFPTTEIRNKIVEFLPKLINYYPSKYSVIKNKASVFLSENVLLDDYVIANGSSEIIRIILRCLVRGTLCVPVPSFGEYYNYLPGDRIIFYETQKNDFQIEARALVEFVKTKNIQSLILVNPNNPTALAWPPAQLRWLLEALRTINLIVVDESFLGFAGADNQSLQEVYRDFPNLVIVKSLGKEMGVPGLRLGLAISANKTAIETITRELPIWNINSLAEFFVEVFSKHKNEFLRSLQLIVENRDFLVSALRKFYAFRIYPSPAANFIFGCLTNAMTVQELNEILYKKNRIIIKDLTGKPGIEGNNYFRLSVRDKDKNTLLLRTLKEIFFSN